MSHNGELRTVGDAIKLVNPSEATNSARSRENFTSMCLNCNELNHQERFCSVGVDPNVVMSNWFNIGDVETRTDTPLTDICKMFKPKCL